jgi:glutamyl-tRNA synthetase
VVRLDANNASGSASATVVARFAPSPSGALHLGNARTALFNFLLARSQGGRFLLRVEDTDAARSEESLVLALYRDLAWLGLAWDEGPDRDGPAAPYRQSQRASIYEEHLQRLEQAGQVYRCYCTATELELERRAQRAAGKPPRYSGRCRDLSDAERAAREAQGMRASLRFRVPAGRRVEFEDLVYGAQSFATDDIGDFVVRREDGSAAFLFASVLDDALMGVTHVLRGSDHLANTPRQLLLLEAMGLAAPRYAHVSLLTGQDQAPLSKREGALSLRDLADAGYAGQAVCNHLYRLGHSSADNRLLDLPQMAQGFQVAHLQRASAHFELSQLAHWQSEWVRSLDAARLRAWLAPWLPAGLEQRFGSEQLDAFIAAVRGNLVLPADLAPWLKVVFGESPDYDESALAAAHEAGPEFFAAAARLIGERPGGAEPLNAIGKATGRRGAALYTPLRAALTGQLHGPQLAPLLALMPPGAARARLAQFAGAAP